LIIIASCTAVFLLLREERTQDQESQHYRSRSRPDSSYSKAASGKWYSRILDLSGSGSRSKHTRSDKSQTKDARRGQGWLQPVKSAGWDSDSDEEQPTPKVQLNNHSSATVRMKEYEHSTNTMRPSTGGSSPAPVSRAFSASSDISFSTMHLESQPIRNLGYTDVYAPTPQRSIPSIQSQVNSPSTSPSPPGVLRQPNRMLSTSPISVQNVPSTDPSIEGAVRQFSTHSGLSVRTFESGSKFIEAL